MAKKQGFSRFKWNRSGYQAVQNSLEIQSWLSREAGYKEGNANAAYGEQIYRVSKVQGKFAKGYVVSCATPMPKKPNTKKYRGHDNAKRIAILKKQVGA